jgi:hypothetical protein
MLTEEERTHIQNQYSRKAINLAVQGQWEEAIAINKAILELFPEDVDCFNLLGKAWLKPPAKSPQQHRQKKSRPLVTPRQISRSPKR